MNTYVNRSVQRLLYDDMGRVLLAMQWTRSHYVEVKPNGPYVWAVIKHRSSVVKYSHGSYDNFLAIVTSPLFASDADVLSLSIQSAATSAASV